MTFSGSITRLPENAINHENPMPSITPISALHDNYIWLLSDKHHAVVVDPSDAVPVLTYLKEHDLTLQQIWITHNHSDHTNGIAELKHHFPDVLVYGAQDIHLVDKTLNEGGHFVWQNHVIQVWKTAGHTEEHLSYLIELSGSLNVFCGDTLFSAGCGRAFTERIDWLFASLQRFNSLPENTLFYPAHEYTEANLRFAQKVEPENEFIQAALAELSIPSLPTTLLHERLINPFLRTDKRSVQHAAKTFSGCDLPNEEAVFIALREWKNQG